MPFASGDKGFSLLEIMVTILIGTGVVMGGAKLFSDMEKNKYEMNSQTDALAVQKIVEAHFITSPKGCETLINKRLNTEFTFKLSPEASTVYGQGTKIADIEITGLRLVDFVPFEPDGLSGIVKVELKTLKRNSKRGARREFPVAVNVVNNIIESCNFNLSRDFNELVNSLCAGAYGYPEGTLCEEVVALLRKAAVEKICQDAYGDPVAKPAKYTTVNGKSYCNLSLVHSGQNCPGKYLIGYAQNGVAVCVD